MGASVLISLVLAILQSVLVSAKVSGIAPEIIALIEAAVSNLLKVQGTDVTYSQLESLRIKTEW